MDKMTAAQVAVFKTMANADFARVYSGKPVRSAARAWCGFTPTTAATLCIAMAMGICASRTSTGAASRLATTSFVTLKKRRATCAAGSRRFDERF